MRQRTFYTPIELWKQFMKIAKTKGVSTAERLRELMIRDVKENEQK